MYVYIRSLWHCSQQAARLEAISAAQLVCGGADKTLGSRLVPVNWPLATDDASATAVAGRHAMTSRLNTNDERRKADAWHPTTGNWWKICV